MGKNSKLVTQLKLSMTECLLLVKRIKGRPDMEKVFGAALVFIHFFLLIVIVWSTFKVPIYLNVLTTWKTNPKSGNHSVYDKKNLKLNHTLLQLARLLKSKKRICRSRIVPFKNSKINEYFLIPILKTQYG